MQYSYEIFLKHSAVGAIEWSQFLLQIGKYLGKLSEWEIHISCDKNVIHYYLCTPIAMPTSLDLIDFLLKPCPLDLSVNSKFAGLHNNKWQDNFVSAYQNLRKHQCRAVSAHLHFRNLYKILSGSIRVSYMKHDQLCEKQLILFAPAKFLSIDFDKSKTFLFKKFPKYLKLEKVTRLLSSDSEQALLEIDPFPYFDTTTYLHLGSFDFAKHSLVIGGSGSGKSKFLASMIDKTYHIDPNKYKIVVIDPHDALYQDCADIDSKSVINFLDLGNSIDLFKCRSEDINAGVELMLTLFHSLMNDSYNGRLERVLRYTTYLLIMADQFSFLTLRKLLLDLAYRNEMLAKFHKQLPASVAHFFLTDFNELKAQSYNDAIAPIVAFIDEMQMVPVFNSEQKLADLSQKVQDNFLNIFSLNRLKLGNKVTQTIAGLLMQQLFLLAEQKLDQHLIIIIDEVSTVENPIIARFLSELRKYNTSVILAGQYFDQISTDLRAAIFANITNYYLFRVSQSDASLLTKNLKIKIEGSDNPEDQLGILTGLKSRECLVQICSDDEILPIFKARTTEFICRPIEKPITKNTQKCAPSGPQPVPFDFQIDTASLEAVTKTYSTNRKINKE